MKLVCLFLLIFSANLYANQADSDSLKTRLNNLTSMQADFTQITRNQNKIVQKSVGTMALLKPNQFRWEILKPNQQLIIADGKKLWVYDIDLEQVTVEPIEKAFAGTPMMFLSGSSDVLKNYDIQASQNKYTLIPHNKNHPDTQFQKIEIFFENNQLIAMHLFDTLEQGTELLFENIRIKLKPSKQLFKFKTPEGVDEIEK